MKTEHTPEPWSIFDGDQRAIVTVANPMLSLLSVDDEGMAIMFEQSDARRIVACVNRLAQFTTEQIDDFGYDLFAEDRPRLVEAQNEIHLLKKQRDELLAACDALLEWDFVRGFRLPYKVRDPIIAAIASVKGEQP